MPAPDATQRLLTKRTDKVISNRGTYEAACAEWKIAQAPKRHIQRLLTQMAHGVKRCMYCEDNLGTDIDHFQPIKEAPLRAFDWLNHLLACSNCNSNIKRDQYPCDSDGYCLLIDPSSDDPADHLTLLLSSGIYKAKTDKGVATVEVFGLNRDDLVQGRKAAFVKARSTLRDWHRQLQAGELGEAEIIAKALRESPFAGVMRAMERLPTAVAPVTLGLEAEAAVRAWRENEVKIA